MSNKLPNMPVCGMILLHMKMLIWVYQGFAVWGTPFDFNILQFLPFLYETIENARKQFL